MLTLIAVGKLKESFYREACAEYEKRLRAFGGVKLLELPEKKLPEDPSPAQIREALRKEGEAVLEKLPKNAWLCAMAVEGKTLSSEALAEKFRTLRTGGKSELVFLIGSSYGLSQEIKSRADYLLSMSPMTFPHHLARVMVLEQLYRAESMLAGSRYHK